MLTYIKSKNKKCFINLIVFAQFRVNMFLKCTIHIAYAHKMWC